MMTSRFAVFAASTLGLLSTLSPRPAEAAEPSPSYAVTSIRLFPAPGKAAMLKGGEVRGSNDTATTDYRTIAKLPADAKEGEWVELKVDKPLPYRYVAYFGANNSYTAIAELEFYSGDRKLAGQGFGTNGARNNGDAVFAKALDGDTATYYEGREPNAQYVGLDFGEGAQVKPPALSVAPGAHPGPVQVELSTTTPGATIRYFLGGRTPDAKNGEVYSKPISIKHNTILSAVAYAEGLAPSPLVIVAYRIGENANNAGAIRTFHIGNSLTDTTSSAASPFPAPRPSGCGTIRGPGLATRGTRRRSRRTRRSTTCSSSPSPGTRAPRTTRPTTARGSTRRRGSSARTSSCGSTSSGLRPTRGTRSAAGRRAGRRRRSWRRPRRGTATCRTTSGGPRPSASACWPKTRRCRWASFPPDRRWRSPSARSRRAS
jgi:hypothetical protein